MSRQTLRPSLSLQPCLLACDQSVGPTTDALFLRDVDFKDTFLPTTLFAVCGSEVCGVLSDTLTGQQVKRDHLSLTTPTSAELKKQTPLLTSEVFLCLQKPGSTDYTCPGHFPFDVSDESGGSKE